MTTKLSKREYDAITMTPRIPSVVNLANKQFFPFKYRSERDAAYQDEN